MNEDYIRGLPTERLLNIKNIIQENENMTFEGRVNSLEAAVSKLIAMAEEEEKKPVEQVEEKEDMKAEEEEVRAEEKKVPITTVTAEEEEEKKEVGEEEEEEKLRALEDKVKQLASILHKKAGYVADDGRITPKTPEDEPMMKKVKIPAVKSGPVDSGVPDVADPKRGKKLTPFETPSMKPGSKTMKVGASYSQKSDVKFDPNIKSLEEIFEFAAARGITPMHAGMPILKRV